MLGELPVFTVSVKGKLSRSSPQTVDLHSSCHMRAGDVMAECDACHVWYHRHCMDIDVFGDSDVLWKCKMCVQH